MRTVANNSFSAMEDICKGIPPERLKRESVGSLVGRCQGTSTPLMVYQQALANLLFERMF